MNLVPWQVVRTSAFLKYGSFLYPSTSGTFLLIGNYISSHRSRPFQCLGDRSYTWSTWGVAISNSSPVLFCQESLSYIHDITGLPWWSVILLSTVAIRSSVTLPLSVYQNHIIARLENVRKELGANIGPALNKEVAASARRFGWDQKHAKGIFRKNMHRHYTRLVIRDNCHPFKCVILALIQIPIWICFSFSLRNLSFMMPVKDFAAHLTYLELKVGGTLWFTDLTVPDTIFIPLLLTAVNFTLIELNALRRIGNSTLIQKISVNLMRIITLLVSLVATVNPSVVSFYWLCSSTFGLAQNILFMMPKVRRSLGIPHTSGESATPFQDIVKNLRTILSKQS